VSAHLRRVAGTAAAPHRVHVPPAATLGRRPRLRADGRSGRLATRDEQTGVELVSAPRVASPVHTLGFQERIEECFAALSAAASLQPTRGPASPFEHLVPFDVPETPQRRQREVVRCPRDKRHKEARHGMESFGVQTRTSAARLGRSIPLAVRRRRQKAHGTRSARRGIMYIIMGHQNMGS